MKKRYIYLLLFLIPGLFASVLITLALFGAAYGALWLFVYGDTAWPDWTEQVMPFLLLVIFSSTWITAIITGYFVGKKLERVSGFDVKHLWISLGFTLLTIVIMLFHQLSIGNLGPKSDSQLCGDYCSELGYDMSSVSPRDSGGKICSCLGRNGEEEISLSIEDLQP